MNADSNVYFFLIHFTVTPFFFFSFSQFDYLLFFFIFENCFCFNFFLPLHQFDYLEAHPNRSSYVIASSPFKTRYSHVRLAHSFHFTHAEHWTYLFIFYFFFIYLQTFFFVSWPKTKIKKNYLFFFLLHQKWSTSNQASFYYFLFLQTHTHN